MINMNVARWIRASINKHFTSVFDGLSIAWIVENNPDVNKIKNQPQWAEIRVNGPRLREGTLDDFHIEVEISILCSVALNSDIYMIDRLIGTVQNAMIGFPVKKLGDGVGDDQTQLGCLVLREDVPRPVDTLQWGEMTDQGITQAVVEGYYKLDL